MGGRKWAELGLGVSQLDRVDLQPPAVGINLTHYRWAAATIRSLLKKGDRHLATHQI